MVLNAAEEFFHNVHCLVESNTDDVAVLIDLN